MKNYLLLVDLEGIHGIEGDPMCSLTKSHDYILAEENAVKEVNTVCRALFDTGADKVYVWDNHAKGQNLDFGKIDKRATQYKPEHNALVRLDFLKELDITGNLFLGYHAREGTRFGVLAHSFNSSAVQYYKFDGKPYGEYEMDAIFSAEYGVPSIFAAADTECVKQMKSFTPEIVTVITKEGLGRNKAIFRDEDTLLSEIYENVKLAVNTEHKVHDFKFPFELEVRYTRMELADFYYERNRNEFSLPVEFDEEDCHILRCPIKNAQELKMFL